MDPIVYDKDLVEAPGAPFVGRGPELSRLEGFLQQAIDGSGRVVFISGEPGIGKTSLSDEFLRARARASPVCRFLADAASNSMAPAKPTCRFWMPSVRLLEGPVARSTGGDHANLRADVVLAVARRLRLHRRDGNVATGNDWRDQGTDDARNGRCAGTLCHHFPCGVAARRPALGRPFQRGSAAALVPTHQQPTSVNRRHVQT